MSTAPLSNSTNINNSIRTNVPSNLQELPKEELVRLLKRVANERDAVTLHEDEQARKKVKAAPPAPVVVVTKTPPFNAAAVKKRIASNTFKAVKKAAHNRTKKPWTEIHDSLPSSEALGELMQGYAPISETARLIKYELYHTQAHLWLGCEEVIENCKFDGKVWCPRGSTPHFKADACFEKVEIKYEKNQGSLSLKFRTYQSGSCHH